MKEKTAEGLEMVTEMLDEMEEEGLLQSRVVNGQRVHSCTPKGEIEFAFTRVNGPIRVH